MSGEQQSGDKDVDWLRALLVRLLENASSCEAPDHPACAKYADLLFRMLPHSNGSGKPEHPDSKSIAAIRLALQGDGKA